MLLSAIFFSCTGATEVTLSSDSIEVQDTFKKSNGGLYKFRIKVVAALPVEYKDQASTKQLKDLFCKSVLKSPDGVNDMKAALSLYAKSIISQNSPLQVGVEASSSSHDDYENADVDNFEIVINITSVYNDNELLSFCCEKIVKKNSSTTSVSHRYVNLDLQAMKMLSHSDLFISESVPQITQMLKSKLIETQNVKDEDELYLCGYYNLQNLSVTDNFFFSDKGITWCYEPGVLSVQGVGETSLLLPFEELMRFKCEESVLDRI